MVPAEPSSKADIFRFPRNCRAAATPALTVLLLVLVLVVVVIVVVVVDSTKTLLQLL